MASALGDLCPPDLGGHRVVRLIAREPGQLIALVHADGATHIARVIDVVHSGAPVIAELAAHEALARCSSEVRDHVALLVDLFTVPDGRLVLLVEPVLGPTLAELLESRRGRFALGEVVTVLAPILGAVLAAHEAGVTGLGLDPVDIRFDRGGAPVIVRLDGATVGPVLPSRFRADEPAYRADLEAVVRLAEEVARALPPDEGEQVREVLRGRVPGATERAALFDLAEPVPVRLGVDDLGDIAARAALPPRSLPDIVASLPAASGGSPEPATARSPVRTAIRDALRALALPPAVIRAVDDSLDRVAAVASRVREVHGLRALPVTQRAARARIRPRFFVVAGAAVVAIALAIALGAQPEPGPAVAERPIGDPPVDESPAHDPLMDERPIPGVPAPGRSSLPEEVRYPEAEEWPAIVDELVARWVACRAAVDDGSASSTADCALEVAHPGSAAERLLVDSDVRHGLLGGWAFEGGEAVVTERMGGAVLVDLIASDHTTAASLLLFRSEAGWRVRDVRG